ncbi:NAD(P)-binding domain-containing protein, partial [Acinetobacter baumannii]
MQLKSSLVSIIGFGRFGQLLADIFANDFKVQIVEPSSELQELAKSKGLAVVDKQDALKAESIFFCVPISK